MASINIGNGQDAIIIREDQLKPCGECKACCTVLAVGELKKRNYTHCQHECENGCGIYGEHPDSCKGYMCWWKVGLLQGDERRRPDKLGIIVDYRPALDVVLVWEVWPGASEESQARYQIMKLMQKHKNKLFHLNTVSEEVYHDMADAYWERVEKRFTALPIVEGN
jgi:hypothetical protein